MQVFNFEKISEVRLVNEENVLGTYAYVGEIIFNAEYKLALEFIRSVKEEALRKYKRMHYETSATRFDKSWTGLLGEEVCKFVLSKFILSKFKNVEICEKQKVYTRGYDGGDVVLNVDNKQRIINVSTRKLSKKDDVLNVVLRPDEYFVLIPEDQFEQYTVKSRLALFVFLKPKSENHVQIDNDTLSVITKADFIIPGYLTNTDVLTLKEKGYIFFKRKEEKIRGLYDSLTYEVQMHTNNYVIFVNFLKKFSLKQLSNDVFKSH